MNSSSILPRQATKKRPHPPPSSTSGALRTPAPPPPPLLFWFKKKNNRKRKKSRQGKRQKKAPPRPPPSQLNVVRGQKRTGFVHRRMCNSHPKPLRYVIWASLWLLRVKYATNTEIITWKVRTNARFYSRVVMHQKKKKNERVSFLMHYEKWIKIVHACFPRYDIFISYMLRFTLWSTTRTTVKIHRSYNQSQER